MVIANDELVSAIIPTRNRREHLEQAISSVYQQTWPNIELIIINDASSDDTTNFLSKLTDSENVTVKIVHNEVSEGGAKTRNAGIEIANGKYIAFLDDDDFWLPEKIKLQIKLLKEHSTSSSVTCSFYIQYPSGKCVTKNIYPISEDQELLRANCLGGASMCLTTKNALQSIDCFDSSLCCGQDWDLWIKLNAMGPVLVCNVPLVYYRVHEGIRITGNPNSTYMGLRRIFFNYKHLMEPSTRKHHLYELLFHRKILLSQGRFHQQVTSLFRFFFFASPKVNLRYLYRFFKFFITNLSFKNNF